MGCGFTNWELGCGLTCWDVRCSWNIGLGLTIWDVGIDFLGCGLTNWDVGLLNFSPEKMWVFEVKMLVFDSQRCVFFYMFWSHSVSS